MASILAILTFAACALLVPSSVHGQIHTFQQSTCTGTEHSCALSTQGQIKCWGRNNFGQLGYGDTLARGNNPGEMGVNLPPVELDGTAIQIACGSRFTCALMTAGQIKCWGANSKGQLGYGDTRIRGDNAEEMGINLSTVFLGSVRSATQVVAGSEFACALLDTSNVKCWGDNAGGQLGIGSTSNLLAPPSSSIDLGYSGAVRQLAAGSQHICARLSSGRMKCWGQNAVGELGYGDTNNRGDNSGEMGSNLPLLSLGANHQVDYIKAGPGTTCALLSSGELKCWGINEEGELGYGPAPTSNPNIGDESGEMGDDLPAVDFGLSPGVETVHLGLLQTCTTFVGGRVKCYGAVAGATGVPNDDIPFLNLGNGTMVDILDLRSEHTCAVLTRSGQAGFGIKCWGKGDAGRLGYGNEVSLPQSSGLGDALPFVDLSNAPTKAPTQQPTAGPTTLSPSTQRPTSATPTTQPGREPTTAAPTTLNPSTVLTLAPTAHPTALQTVAPATQSPTVGTETTTHVPTPRTTAPSQRASIRPTTTATETGLQGDTMLRDAALELVL